MMKEINDAQGTETSLCREVQLLITGENILINSLHRFLGKVTDEGLKTLLVEQTEATEIYLLRLENILKYLEVSAGTPCNEEFVSLVAEAESMLQLETSTENSDISVLQTALKLVRYKISGYTTAAQFSLALGYSFITELLLQNLEEELEMEASLNDLSLSCINKTAIAA